jgi:hypothetical protein
MNFDRFRLASLTEMAMPGIEKTYRTGGGLSPHTAQVEN